MIRRDRPHAPEGSGSISPSQCHTANSAVPRLSEPKGKHPLTGRRMNEVSLAETQCRSHIYQMSKDKKKSEPGDETALCEWEAEGGSLISEPQRGKYIKLGKQEQYVLYCLGGAVLMQWNELPTNNTASAVRTGRIAEQRRSNPCIARANRPLPPQPQGRLEFAL
jgi:hypothetical protein